MQRECFKGRGELHFVLESRDKLPFGQLAILLGFISFQPAKFLSHHDFVHFFLTWPVGGFLFWPRIFFNQGYALVFWKFICLPPRKISVMPLSWRGMTGMSCSTHSTAIYQSRWMIVAISTIWLAAANAMTQARIAELRQETVGMFYHGFDNYMQVAFPEDEVSYPRTGAPCH